jgi:hypothetical protein
MNKNLKVSDEIIQPEVIKRRQLQKELGNAYVQPVSDCYSVIINHDYTNNIIIVVWHDELDLRCQRC